MSFENFANELSEMIGFLFEQNLVLFRVDVSWEELWELYLDSFPEGTNNIFRERREMDCASCRNFMRQFGNVVGVTNKGTMLSIWDFDANGIYGPVVNALANRVHSAPIISAFVTKEYKIGIAQNYEMTNGRPHVWNHLHAKLPDEYVDHSIDSVEAVVAHYNENRALLQRAFDEISMDAIDMFYDLNEERVIIRAEERLGAVSSFRDHLKAYNYLLSVEEAERANNYAWFIAVAEHDAVVRIGNTAVGTFLKELSSGGDPTAAINNWNKMMDPTNYRVVKSFYTKAQIDAAQRFVEENDLQGSLFRRQAVIDDISINNVLWANRDAAKAMKGTDGLFEMLRDDFIVNPKDFDSAPVTTIKDLLANIANVKSIELLVEERHTPNFVSLITAMYEGPIMFSWENNFSWDYNKGLADASAISERVKQLGGNISGVMRFSIEWNREPMSNNSDYDAHCLQPTGRRIFYGEKFDRNTDGRLDVDIIRPFTQTGSAAENIVFSSKTRLPFGTYLFQIHMYSARNGTGGVHGEVAIGNNLYQFTVPNELSQGQYLDIAKVHHEFSGGLTFEPLIPFNGIVNTQEVWNLKNQWQPVSTIMFSPNYWDGQEVGNKHYFFMIPGCENPDKPKGFHNEFLRQEFREHRKVFQVLAAKSMAEPQENQLSGLGFSSTLKNNVIAKINGKVFKIVF